MFIVCVWHKGTNLYANRPELFNSPDIVYLLLSLSERVKRSVYTHVLGR